MMNAVNFIKENGAADIYAAVTHGVLSDPATERLKNSPIKELVITNTVPVAPYKHIPKLTILSIAPLLAEVIRRIHLGVSVGALFNE